jgi:hypothetical protein
MDVLEVGESEGDILRAESQGVPQEERSGLPFAEGICGQASLLRDLLCRKLDELQTARRGKWQVVEGRMGPREDATVETDASKDIDTSADVNIFSVIFPEIENDIGRRLNVPEDGEHVVPGGSVWFCHLEDEQGRLDRLIGDHDADRLGKLQAFSPSGTDGVGEVVDQLLWGEVRHRKGGHRGLLGSGVRGGSIRSVRSEAMGRSREVCQKTRPRRA